MTTLEIAYSKLTHHALNELFIAGDEGCCVECCAPCAALKTLDVVGQLDNVVQFWTTYDDGGPTLIESGETQDDQTWWRNSQVDRKWLYDQWLAGQMHCAHDEHEYEVHCSQQDWCVEPVDEPNIDAE